MPLEGDILDMLQARALFIDQIYCHLLNILKRNVEWFVKLGTILSLLFIVSFYVFIVLTL